MCIRDRGKEKENIIISTVDDEISDFADDPYLINVALSRAKKKLMLVVTGNCLLYTSRCV